MKVTYTTIDGRFTAEFEGSEIEIFQQIARFDEIFGNLTCSNGKESSDKVKFQVREVDENLYLEQVCVDESKPALRFAKRRFGQNKGKDGKIFPKDGGNWFKWNPETKEEEPLIAGKKRKSEDEGGEEKPKKTPF